MTTTHVQCPHCDQTYALTPEEAPRYAGQMLECAQCGEAFRVPRAVASDQARSGPIIGELFRGEVTAGAYPSGAIDAPSLHRMAEIASRTRENTPPPRRPTFDARAHATPFALSNYDWNPDAEPAPEPTNRLATWSLVCGLIGLVIPVIPGLMAMIFGFTALNRSRRNGIPGAGLALGGISMGLIALTLGSVVMYTRVLPAVANTRLASFGSSVFSSGVSEARCVEHFHTMYGALKDAAEENNGQFPNSLDALVASGAIPPDALVCPATNDTPVLATQPSDRATAFAHGGHLSYTYVGGNLTTKSPPECVLMYEPLDRHRHEGIQVLFVDGRIQPIGRLEAAKAIARLKSGKNPPWSDSGR